MKPAPRPFPKAQRKENYSHMDSFLTQLLGQMTSGSSLSSLSSLVGGETNQVSSVITSALPSLLGALTQNASTDEGASSLIQALAQHDDDSDLSEQIANADAEDGSKIISHILGQSSTSLITKLAGKFGLTKDQVTTILNKIAPSLLSSLNSANKSGEFTKGNVDLSDGLDFSDIVGIFENMFGGKQKKASLNGTDLLKRLAQYSTKA